MCEKVKDKTSEHDDSLLLILFFLPPARAVGSAVWIVGVCEEVVDEVNFGDDVGASVVEGAEFALVDDISSFLHCYSLIYIFLPFYYKKAV